MFNKGGIMLEDFSFYAACEAVDMLDAYSLFDEIPPQFPNETQEAQSNAFATGPEASLPAAASIVTRRPRAQASPDRRPSETARIADAGYDARHSTFATGRTFATGPEASLPAAADIAAGRSRVQASPDQGPPETARVAHAGCSTFATGRTFATGPEASLPAAADIVAGRSRAQASPDQGPPETARIADAGCSTFATGQTFATGPEASLPAAADSAAGQPRAQASPDQRPSEMARIAGAGYSHPPGSTPPLINQEPGRRKRKGTASSRTLAQPEGPSLQHSVPIVDECQPAQVLDSSPRKRKKRRGNKGRKPRAPLLERTVEPAVPSVGSKGQREKKKEKRREKRQEAPKVQPPARSVKFISGSAEPLTASPVTLGQLPRSKPGYIGMPVSANEREQPHVELEDLLDKGYLLAPDHQRDLDRPLLDKEGKVFGLQVKIPAAWQEKVEGFSQALAKLHEDLGPAGLSFTGRRGSFESAWCGYSYGGGQTVPTNFQMSAKQVRAWESFVGGRNVMDVMAYFNGAFRTWFPKIYELYKECQEALIQQYPGLWRLSNCLPFAAMVVNFGPQTVCQRHRDAANLAFGLCGLFVLGDFNFQTGGHLVLHEAKLILPLQAGDLVLFPSAAITHENIPICSGETRKSITWFSAGSLFRWWEQGFQKSTRAKASSGVPSGSRWKEGCALLLTPSEIEAYWEGLAKGC